MSISDSSYFSREGFDAEMVRNTGQIFEFKLNYYNNIKLLLTYDAR